MHRKSVIVNLETYVRKKNLEARLFRKNQKLKTLQIPWKFLFYSFETSLLTWKPVSNLETKYRFQIYNYVSRFKVKSPK